MCWNRTECVCIHDDPPFRAMPAARQSKLLNVCHGIRPEDSFLPHRYPDFLGKAQDHLHPVIFRDSAREEDPQYSTKRHHPAAAEAASKRLAGRCTTGSGPTSTRSQSGPLHDARTQGSKTLRPGWHTVFRDAQARWCKGRFERVHCGYQCLCKGANLAAGRASFQQYEQSQGGRECFQLQFHHQCM